MQFWNKGDRIGERVKMSLCKMLINIVLWKYRGTRPVRQVKALRNQGLFYADILCLYTQKFKRWPTTKDLHRTIWNDLESHNSGRTRYSSNKRPWELFYVEILSTKKEALIREKKIKRCKEDYFIWLKNQSSNILI